jgi:two-component system phosphate regulon sensor histidine kinase PhoR
VKRLFRRSPRERIGERRPSDLALAAARSRALVEESREIVLVLDEDERLVAASRRARESLEDLVEGEPVPERVLRPRGGPAPFAIAYKVDGRRESLLYLRESGDVAAYEELRAGFTAAVSHELRTPLARMLALLETALLPDSNAEELLEQARAEVERASELIDDVLFLSELESGREVVALGPTEALPILRDVADEVADAAARAGVAVRVAGGEEIVLPLRPRMIRIVASNLAENAIRYAGPGSTFTLSVAEADAHVVLAGSDDGVGVNEEDIPRLFERFYRTDRARASRGTGLGLAIVKHVVAAAGGAVEATGARGEGLTIRCIFRVA